MERSDCIAGVGPDQPTVTNSAGAKQAKVNHRFDLFPRFIFDVAAVLDAGAIKYGEWNWIGIPSEQHINHALIHIFAWLHGDCSEHHLAHAACRLLFAGEMEKREAEETAM